MTSQAIDTLAVPQPEARRVKRQAKLDALAEKIKGELNR